MDFSVLPRFLQVELTYACNSSCAFCYNPTHKGKISHERLISILKEVNSYKIRHVQLIGGEVTILPQLPLYLQALEQSGWRSFVTNGRKFREDIRGLFDEVYVSLHGEEDLHEQLTNEIGSFGAIEATIEKYASWGVDVNADTVLTKYNAHAIFDIAKRAKNLGMKRVFLNIFQPEGIGSTRPDFSPSFDQIRDAVTQMVEAKRSLAIDMHFGTSTPLCLDERLFTERLGFRCGTGEWFASINPSGDLRICNHSTKTYGNLLDTPLSRIWHSRSIDTEYRNAHPEQGDCESCPAFSICRGGCRIDQSGKYRVDPIVQRDKARVLDRPTIAAHMVRYAESPFRISNS